MSETAKPVWWHFVTPGEPPGKWHREPLTWGTPPKPIPEEFLVLVLRRQWPLWSVCGHVYAGITTKVEIRRSAPPVAQQCKRCRAAKAKGAA